MDSFDFVVEGNDFVSAVSAAAFALNKRDKDAFIGFKLCDGNLMVEAGNGHFSVDSCVQIEHDNTYFAFSFRLKDALNICKAAKGEKAEFWHAMGTEYANVFIGGAELKIQVFEHVEYTKTMPLSIPVIEVRHTFGLHDGTSELVDLLKTVAYAQAKKDVRRRLCGVNMQTTTGECIAFVATNGERMALTHCAIDKTADFNITLPADVVSLLCKHAKKWRIDFSVYKAEFGGIATIAFGNCMIQLDLFSMERFPDYNRIMQMASKDKTIEFYKSDFINAVKPLLNGKFITTKLLINSELNSLGVLTDNGKVSIPAGFFGFNAGDFFGLNLLYLVDAIKASNNDFIQLHCNSDFSVFRIGGEPKAHILMGCRV